MKKHAWVVVFGLILCLFLASCTSAKDVDENISFEELPIGESEPTDIPVNPDEALTPVPMHTSTITEAPLQEPLPPETEASIEETPTQQSSAEEQGLFLEQRLQALGYVETGLVDGVIDWQTRLGIAHLEWLNGLPITGEATEALFALIRSNEVKAVSKPLPYPARALSRYLPGGTEVSFLSGRLVDLGYLDDTDPSFNPFSFSANTEDAVRQFQKLNGLPTNGVVDFTNWGTIFHPAAIAADGESPLAQFDDWDWSTDFYPLLDDPIDVAYDGQYLRGYHQNVYGSKQTCELGLSRTPVQQSTFTCIQYLKLMSFLLLIY